jgi:hypothetical protein
VAMQVSLVVQGTPTRLLLMVSLGIGVAWITQVLPFQRSPNVSAVLALLTYSPTATQAAAGGR